MSSRKTDKEYIPTLRIGVLLRIARRVSDFNYQRYYNQDSIHHLDREYLVDVILRAYDQDERYRKIITDIIKEEGYLLLNYF